jgi:DNA-binding NarL/FixJ family response regulator
MLLITPTDRQALRLLAQGKPLTDIADSLGIETGEVGAYLASLFSNMGVSTRTEAIVRASQRGLLDA